MKLGHDITNKPKLELGSLNAYTVEEETFTATAENEEELEDETDGDAVDHEGKEEDALEEGAALRLEAQERCQKQGEYELHDGAAHVVEAYGERPEDVVAGEHVPVVPEAHEDPLPDVLHVIEAEADHLSERKVGKGEQEQEGDGDEGSDDELLLSLLAPQIGDKPFAFHSMVSSPFFKVKTGSIWFLLSELPARRKEACGHVVCQVRRAGFREAAPAGIAFLNIVSDPDSLGDLSYGCRA